MRVRNQLAIALSALAGFTAAAILAIYFFGSREILFRQIQSEVLTVLIVDIRNFAAMSAALIPDHLVGFLNEFFGRMIEAIFIHRGTLGKFLGDGCLAIFGAPLDEPDHRHQAVLAAQAMLRSEAELAATVRERHGIELRIGIGIHTGEAIVGYVGSEERMEYTAVGDTVNVASRLEALNKEYGTQLLASAAVVEGSGEGFDWRNVAEVTPRGSPHPIEVFTLAGES